MKKLLRMNTKEPLTTMMAGLLTMKSQAGISKMEGLVMTWVMIMVGTLVE